MGDHSQAAIPAQRANIPSLTGIRGIGALWVFSNHALFALEQMLGFSWEKYSFFAHGYFGVDLFFVLSGFIIAHVHTMDFTDGTLKKFRPFMILRALRIYPLHIFVMLVMLPMALFFPIWPAYEISNSQIVHSFDFSEFLPTLLLVQSWGFWESFSWNGTSWTLSAELLAYFIFPFIIIFSRWVKSPHLNLVFGCTCLLLLGALMWKKDLLEINAAHFAGIARAIFGFTAGCFLNRFFRESKQRFTGIWACTGSILLIAAVLMFESLRPLIYLGLGLLVLSLAYMPTFYGRVVGTGPVLWLGKISFSFYLTHWLVLHLAEWNFHFHNLAALPMENRIAYFVAVVAMIFFVATACYHWIERPSHALGRRLAGRTR